MADFPSVPFSTLDLRSNNPTIITKSINGSESRYQQAAQYWSFTAQFNNITDAQRREIMGFLISRRGPLIPFTIDLPARFQDSSGTFTGTITATAGAGGALSATISFSTLTGQTILKAGDFIKFSNHDKVYMVTNDVTSSPTGTQTRTLNLNPPLRQSVAGTTITYNDVPMYVRCNTDEWGFSSDPTLYSTFNLDFVEVI